MTRSGQPPTDGDGRTARPRTSPLRTGRRDVRPATAERRPAAEDRVQRLAEQLEPSLGHLGCRRLVAYLLGSAGPAEHRVGVRGEELVPLLDIRLDRPLGDVL